MKLRSHLEKTDLADFVNSVSQEFELMAVFMFPRVGIHFDITTELSCLGDFENPGPLPVQEVLDGTDDCVL